MDTNTSYKKLAFALHIAVLLSAITLIFMISIDTLRNVSFSEDKLYLEIQFWICLLYLFDIIIECIISQNRIKYIYTHFIFFLISIPYLNILNHFGLDISGELRYIIRCIPILRAAYVLLTVTTLLTGNRIKSLFSAYIALLSIVVFFSSLMFYVEENNINTDVTTYADALWWAIMCMTTAGSYISEITLIGKVLSVILSGGGLILFPVFTVYITNAVAGKQKHH